MQTHGHFCGQCKYLTTDCTCPNGPSNIRVATLPEFTPKLADTMTNPVDYYYGSHQQLLDLKETSQELVAQLHERERSYRGSWQKRGGIGAFMMLARKIDRLAIALDRCVPPVANPSLNSAKALLAAWQKLEETCAQEHYDIFKAWEVLEQQKDGDMNDLEDFVGYCLHIINEMRTVRPRLIDIAACKLDTEDRKPEAPETVSALDHIHQHGVQPDPGSWQASHPHFYKSASDRQCPSCMSTFVGESDRVGFLHCRTCQCDFPVRAPQPGDSAWDQPFPQAFVARDKNQPEGIHPDRDINKDSSEHSHA